jgi:hypothetical protein
MIAPQIHTSQPGVIGTHHGLQRLTETLTALEQGQQEQQARDTTLQTQLTTQAETLTHVGQWLRYQCYSLVGLTVLVLVLAGAVGWQVTHQPDRGYAHALGALDQAVMQQWSTLPKGTQEALSATYTRLGLVPPGHRSK